MTFKQMRNPNEKNGYVMLFTMQDKRSLDVLKKEKRFTNKLEYAKEHFDDIYEFFREKYTYFVNKAETIVDKPDDVKLPIWCSVSYRNCMKPDPDSVAYCIKVPADKVVYLDGLKWDYVLNNHYVPLDKQDLDDYYKYLKDHRMPNPFLIGSPDYRYLYPQEYKKITDSYDRIFDIDNWDIFAVQANIWEFTEDMVIKVFHYNEPIDISEDDLEKYL